MNPNPSSPRPEAGRTLILCADDFGLSDAISATIAELAGAGRLSATSCMAVLPEWRRQARRLRGLPNLAVGLHLVLSDERPLGPMPVLAPQGVLPGVDPLTHRALLGRVPLAEIADEVHRQFDAFEAEWGRAPDFVDGHQHVHMLRGIRDVVLAVAARRAPDAWVRQCADRLPAILARPHPDRALRSALLSAGLAEAAAHAGLRTNRSFAGYYDFQGDYAALLPRFLARAASTHLVMCHPGAGRLPGDRIAEARIREAEVLRSPAFPELLARAGLSLGPHRPAAPPLRLAG
jgi:hypothetical protein